MRFPGRERGSTKLGRESTPHVLRGEAEEREDGEDATMMRSIWVTLRDLVQFTRPNRSYLD